MSKELVFIISFMIETGTHLLVLDYYNTALPEKDELSCGGDEDFIIIHDNSFFEIDDIIARLTVCSNRSKEVTDFGNGKTYYIVTTCHA